MFSNNSSWVGGVAPSLSGVNGNTTIYGYITTSGGLILNNNKILTIKDTLVINGDLTLKTDADLVINESALLIVNGNVVINNKVDLAFGSHFIVSGNFTVTGSQSTIAINEGASIYILGTVSAASIPGFVCDSTSYYVPPGDVDCVYGDIISFEDNENGEGDVYEFFVSKDNLKGISPAYTELCGIPEITVSALFTGGTNYLWYDSLGINIVGTGTSFTTDQPGEYYATFTYNNATVTTYRAKVKAPETTATVSVINCSCPGTPNGAISIANPSGGSGTYEYSVTGGISWSSYGNFTGLSTGTYDVRIRDKVSLCTKILNAGLEVKATDTIAPTIICPSDITAQVDPGTCEATGVNLGIPTTSDNCSVNTVTNNVAGPFEAGITTITWTATDGSGNTATCQQSVTVYSNESIEIAVEDLGNSCQSGETGSETTIIWEVTKISGPENWVFDYVINDGTSDVASGIAVTVTGDNAQITFNANNQTGLDKTFSLTVMNVTGECGETESNLSNNNDTVTLWGVPDTSEIMSN